MSPPAREQTIRRAISDCLVCGAIIQKIARVVNSTGQLALLPGHNFDGQVGGQRAYIDQTPSGLKHPPALLQSMNHALVGHSSKGPDHQSQVERFRRKGQRFGSGLDKG